MRIMSFNANGLRAAARKGFFEWFMQQNVDILCVQETKAQTHQLLHEMLCPSGYFPYFRDATCKKGYSGVAIYSKQKPHTITDALGWPDFDEEGRFLAADFDAFRVVSMYLPSGSANPSRQIFKFQVMQWLQPILKDWLHSGRNHILCGDWNIVRSKLDIRNWSANQKNSGCLPAEREWINALCADEASLADIPSGKGWVDTFRVCHPHLEQYSWWSARGTARQKNVGWRIDYQLATPKLRHALEQSVIFHDVHFSDHAPYAVDYML